MNDFNFSFPIDMIKKEQRLISGIATADNVDKSNDVVEFAASEIAFKNWQGNIREMHAPIAVGKAISYKPIKMRDSEGKEYNAIEVEAYISKGAEATWQKVLDGTLRAFSIGGRIMKKELLAGKMHNGRPINIIKEYELGELSLVDNPANALATIDLVKRNIEGNLDYIINPDFEKADKPRLKDPRGGLTAAGRAHFKQTEGANLKPGVKGPANTPEKMRRKGSFLTRFFTNPSGPMKDSKGRPTRLALSARAWGEPVPQNAEDAAALAAKGRRLLERYANTKKNASENNFDKNLLDAISELMQDQELIIKATNLVSTLQNLMANVVVFYASAHRAHWNVEGVDFIEYHELFANIYEDVYGSIDPMAELIRKLGAFPPSLDEGNDMASIEDDSATSDSRALAIDLYMKNYGLIIMLKNAFNVANAENEQGVANFIAERIDMHQTWDWQLTSSLKVSGVEIPLLVEDGDETNIKNAGGVVKLEKPCNWESNVDKGLHNDVNYDKVINMEKTLTDNKLSLIKKFINWVVDNSEENLGLEKSDHETETLIEEEVSVEQVEEPEMDIEVLKEALGTVIDQKLTDFAKSFKEEVDASVSAKIEEVAKSVEIQKEELAAKLAATEVALEEQTAKVEQIAHAGAMKKSVDLESDEDSDKIAKSQAKPESFWKNVYLDQGLIESLGYKS
jgi:DNA-binding ferritin-like protein